MKYCNIGSTYFHKRGMKIERETKIFKREWTEYEKILLNSANVQMISWLTSGKLPSILKSYLCAG
jgi:hypothetical protein